MNFHDGYMVVGQPLGALPQDVLLVSDNTVVMLQPKTALLKLQSDNTTAANRTFTLTDGYIIGQELLLIFVSAGATTAQLQDAGNVALSAAWEPTLDDTLTLRWSGAKWLETARSDN
jgi:hypothetical protein